jgi:hypothetical protein
MWVVWRQQRSIVIAFALLAVVVSTWVLITGLHEQSLWRQFLSAPCKGDVGLSATNAQYCERLQFSVFHSGNYNEVVVGIGITFAPLFGLILGVNAVAHEIEQKTNRLAWTQSGSRARWLMNKYLVSVSSLVVILVPMCLLLSWWVGATHDGARITPKIFAISGYVEVACGIFCFVLALLVGLLLRRPGWSLAVGGVLTVAIFLSFATQVLPNLLPQSVAVVQSSEVAVGTSSGVTMSGGPPANSWPRGPVAFAPKTEKGFPSASVMNQSMSAMYRCERLKQSGTYCLEHLGLVDVQAYIPGNQYWTLQSLEGGFYIVAAALLAALSIFAVRKAMA